MIKIAHVVLAAAVLMASVGSASAQDYRRHEGEGRQAPQYAAPRGPQGEWRHGEEQHARWEGRPYSPPAYGYAAPPAYGYGYGYGEPVRESEGPDVGALAFGLIAGGMIAAILSHSAQQ